MNAKFIASGAQFVRVVHRFYIVSDFIKKTLFQYWLLKQRFY